MKTITFLLIGTLAGGAAFADPFQKENVSADAKWLVHLDVENLLTTQLGGFLGREFLDKQIAKPASDLSQQFGIDLDWRQIQSVTVYGTDFRKAADAQGVLLIKSKFNVAESLDTVIAKLAGQLGEGNTPLRKLTDTPFALYTANNEVFGAAVRPGFFLLSKSREQIEKAQRVIAGKSPNLSAAKSFAALPDTKGFLVVSVADAFNQGLKLPGPAQGLKNAEGGQAVAGEKGDRVFVNLAVQTKDTESATQMQQVLQGLLAMAALSQNENPDLQKLVQGLKVGGHDKVVSVNLEVPTADVIARVTETKGETKKKKRG